MHIYMHTQMYIKYADERNISLDCADSDYEKYYST